MTNVFWQVLYAVSRDPYLNSVEMFTVCSRYMPLQYVFKLCKHGTANLAVIASSRPGTSGKMTATKVKEKSGARSGELVGCLCQSVSTET
jgi:hypothetical protein